MAIRSIGDRATETFFLTGRVPRGVGWSSMATVARRKLEMLHYAARLLDRRSPPGNRLEALGGTLRGLHSIRANDRWRVVFRWSASDTSEVRVIDYH